MLPVFALSFGVSYAAGSKKIISLKIKLRFFGCVYARGCKSN